MTQRSLRWLESMGLVDPSKAHVRRGGAVTLDRGAIPTAGLAQEDVMKWVQTVLRPALAAHGFRTDDAAVAEVLRSGMRQTVTGGLAELLRNAPAFEKDTANVVRAAQVDQYGLMMGVPQKSAIASERRAQDTYGMEGTAAPPDPVAKMESFTTAWKNLMTALGVPMVDDAIGIVDRLTKVLTALGKWASENGKTVAVIESFTAAVAGLAVVGGTITVLTAALSPFGKVIGKVRAAMAESAGAEVAAGELAGGIKTVTGALSLSAVGSAVAGALALGAAISLLLGIAKVGSDYETPETHAKQDELSRQRRKGATGGLGDPVDGYGVAPRAPGSEAPVRNESYRRPSYAPSARDLVVNVHSTTVLDGEVIHRSMQKRMARDMAKPPHSTGDIDPRLSLLYSA